jgi:CRP-like cAMP-binding protein/arsenate reductase-like glutaredoxin family protein
MGQEALKVKSPQKKGSLKKSGLRALKSGEVLFNDGDPADSLFIIQKGQIRLYKPKGRGFIELAVLRVGEVLGEMAYFDSRKTGPGTRSCAAQAIVPSEIIEISFTAFGKTLESLNPWFKSIIQTLADRLRNTNRKVKDLESNNVSSYGSSVGYKFLRMSDVVKYMSTLFLVVRSVGKIEDATGIIHMNQFRTFGYDIFNLPESKVEAFFELLMSLGHMSIENDKEGMPKVYRVKDCDNLRKMTLFLNTQRILPDEKRILIGHRCETFLEKILYTLEGETKDMAEVDLSAIIEDFEFRGVKIDHEDLQDAIDNKLVEEVAISEKGMKTVVHLKELRKMIDNIRLLNAFHKLNEQRDKANRY